MRFFLSHYETGWDKRWETREGRLVIAAHAPSRLVLTAAGSCTARVTALIQPGGRSAAKASVNGTPVAYDAPMDVVLAENDPLALTASIEGSKDQCWNLWAIDGAEILPASNPCITFWKDAHLGDSLGMMIACENFASANGISIKLDTTPLFEDIFRLFCFQHVQLVPRAGGATHIHPFGYEFEKRGWINGIALAIQLALGGRLPAGLHLPRLRQSPANRRESIILIQFDSRSQGTWDSSTLRAVLSLYHGKRFACIGGPDTPPYMGESFEYRLGPLDFIIEQLLACERFVGVDSGIAHLACILGVDTEIFLSPTSGGNFVEGLFSSYPVPPRVRTIRAARAAWQVKQDLLIMSTTNGWNLGDDLIRDGVLKLLGTRESDPVVWFNRSQMATRDKKRHCDWTPSWRLLRNLGDLRSLFSHARAFVVAGTPEWIDTVQELYELSAIFGVPIWIVGVGGGQQGQLQHLRRPHAEGLIVTATARDEAAMAALGSCGIPVKRFLDPAFHSYEPGPVTPGKVIFNPRLGNDRQRRLYKTIYSRIRTLVDVVTVHEPSEYHHARELFDRPVFYNSDYRQYVVLYSSCSTYVGGRMHGAIPALVSGASVHLIAHEGKHLECRWWKTRLGSSAEVTVWNPTEAEQMDLSPGRINADLRDVLRSDFLEHQQHLAELTASGGSSAAFLQRLKT